MPPIHPSIRTRTALLLLLALLAIWTLSGWRQVAYLKLDLCTFSINRGEVDFVYLRRDPSHVFRPTRKRSVDIQDIFDQVARLSRWPYRLIRPWNWSLPTVRFHHQPTFTYAAATVPLWTPILITALASALFFHRDRRAAPRALTQTCPHCLYSLRGLPPTSPCPECGLASSPQQA